jgi:pimeloyl-ACP methyl ester carboxylesterase
MPYARNPEDDVRTYFEDDGGEGTPVVFYGGFGEPIGLVRDAPVTRAVPHDEFRHIYVDHRGHGCSDKPHHPEAYSMPLRVGDALAVLDDLGIEQSHFVGMSWGGRLGFGIGEHIPERILSLVIGGQQPYRWPDSPLVRVVTEGLAASRRAGSMLPLLEAFERFWNVTFPEERRTLVMGNDPAALQAAWQAALGEGAIASDLRSWHVPCLIFIGKADLDFFEQAEQAAVEIPGAEFRSMVESDHYHAHTHREDEVFEAVLRMLRTHS